MPVFTNNPSIIFYLQIYTNIWHGKFIRTVFLFFVLLKYIIQMNENIMLKLNRWKYQLSTGFHNFIINSLSVMMRFIKINVWNAVLLKCVFALEV